MSCEEKYLKKVDKDYCSECNGDIILTSYEKICANCGLVIEEILSDSSYKFTILNERSNQNKQYVALGDRTDFIGGLGTYIDFEGSKYLKDKAGKLLDPNRQSF